MTHEYLTGLWQTPGGRTAILNYRPGTNDWNVISSCLAPGDEYRLPVGLTGWAVDIGAHLGAVTVGLALDNPGLRVVAVEPVPPNAELLRLNVYANGLQDRVIVIQKAAGFREPVEVRWGFRGSELAEHHAFIGNSWLADEYVTHGEHQTARDDDPVTFSWLATYLRSRITWCKLDAEGAEWDVLRDPGLAMVDYITGEYHPVGGAYHRSDLLPLLEPTHVVTFSDPPAGVDPEYGPGPFVAVRR